MNKLTLEGFIAFCSSKPKDEKYDPGDVRACAFAQYAISEGYNDDTVNYVSVSAVAMEANPHLDNFVGADVPIHWWPAIHSKNLSHTFGALTSLLKEIN